MARVLDFLFNWNNKLGCNYFTTIRKATEYNRKSLSPGSVVEIHLQNKFQYLAEVYHQDVLLFSKIRISSLLLDTGYTYDECVKLFCKMNNCSENELMTRSFVLVYLKQLKSKRVN